MKSMSCKELGGACDHVFRANTFEKIAEMNKQHGIEMFQKKEPTHLEAMQKMQVLMKNPQEMQAWFEEKRSTFDALAED